MRFWPDTPSDTVHPKMAPISSFTASYGARLAHAMSRRSLEVALGGFLLLMGTRFLFSLVR